MNSSNSLSPSDNKGVKAIILLTMAYLNLTTLEWMVHKYVMHGYERENVPVIGSIVAKESRAHWKHHRQVLSDMRLDIEDESNKHEGLFFQYHATFLFTTILFLLFTAETRLFRIPVGLKTILIMSVVSTVGYSFLWNNFHSMLHGADNIFIPGKRGVPNWYQEDVINWIPSIWFEWMMLNHAQHHAVKGPSKGNYNIILPGFDYVMGTYNSPPCFDNTSFCKDDDSNLKACDKPRGCFSVRGSKKLDVKFENF